MTPQSAWNLGKNILQKGATLGGKVFGMGKGKALWNDKYANLMGKKTLIQQRNRLAATGQLGAKIAAVGTGTNLLQNAIGDAGPEGDEFQERAYNQVRYGVDMTDAQMEEAIGKGQRFQDTGLIGEGGLNEEQVIKYLEKASEDKRGGWEKAASAGLSGLAMVPGLGTILGTPAEMVYDKFTGDHRRQGLKNAVDSLKLDANAMKMRKDMEGKQGKFMAEGILGKDFGRGNVSGLTEGGIKPPVDREAQAAEAAALKEYEAIKAKDGVHAALASPAALKAGRQVYLDVQEAAGGDKNTAEALLSGVGGQSGFGLTDQATTERYYGNPEANAKANNEQAAKMAAEAAKQNPQVTNPFMPNDGGDVIRSGEISLKPAETPEQVLNNQAVIATQKGFHGQSPISIEQQAYMNARGQKSAMQMENSLNDSAWKSLFERHQKQATANAQAARNYIAPQHRMGNDPNRDAWQAAQAAKVFGGPNPVNSEGQPLKPVPTLPAQVNESANTPGIPSNIAPPRPNPGLVPPTVQPTVSPSGVMKPTPYGVGTTTPGFPKLPDIGAPVRNAVENALTQKSSRPANVMAPTPYGLGTATPGMPQVPDIGAPVRNAVDRALTQQTSRPSNVMAPTPYGLGTATPGVPQAPDIGAPVRNAVQGALTQQSSPPGVAPKKPMDPAEIAKLIAEQERQKVEARNKANPHKSPIPRPNPMGRFIR